MDMLSIHCNRLQHLEDRIIRFGFNRAEFYNFDPADLPALKLFIREQQITPSIHCPLRKAPWYPHPVTWSFLSSDVHHKEREMSFRLIQESLEDGTDIGAAYVVVHYPTPASPHAGRMSHSEQYDIAWNSAQRLQTLSEEYATPIYIEGFGPSPFMNSEFIVSVLETFPALRYCFDTGHMMLMSQRDNLDYFGFLEEVAPYVGCVHVWNVRHMEDYKAFHHLPPHPALSPADGWVDMERVIRTIRRTSPSAVWVLEYSSDLPDEWELDQREGIAWFKALVNATEPAGFPTSYSDLLDRRKKNIVLAGFMGTGKTQVGKALAARLGRPFIDMDDVLIDRFGMSIPEVFESQGEAVFRAEESRLCRELALREGLIISTGGGALVTEGNREAFLHTSFLVCLQCELDEIMRRIGQGENRPMLSGNVLRERIETLLDKRRTAYEAIPYQVDTTCRTIDQVANEILQIWDAENGACALPPEPHSQD